MNNSSCLIGIPAVMISTIRRRGQCNCPAPNIALSSSFIEQGAMYDRAAFRYFRYLPTILRREWFQGASGDLHPSQSNPTIQGMQFRRNASVRLFRRMKNRSIRPAESRIAFITLARFLLEMRNEVIDALNVVNYWKIGSMRFECNPIVDQGYSAASALCTKESWCRAPSVTHGDTARLTLVSTTCENHPSLKAPTLRVILMNNRTPSFHRRQLQPLRLPIRNPYSLARDKT
jgi:hypothetical protein